MASQHYGKWATKFATSPRGRIRRDVVTALQALHRNHKLQLLKIHEAPTATFELDQISDGRWNCRITVGTATTSCIRDTAKEAVHDCLSAHGTEVPE